MSPAYRMVPLTNNSRNQQWYIPEEQNWAEVDVDDLSHIMRSMFEKPELRTKARDTIVNKFNFDTVGTIMKKRLEEIINENSLY
jgi:hypothetical protein